MENRQPSVDAFGGVTGRVLREAMSAQSLVTGLTMVITLGAIGYIMSQFESGDTFLVIMQLATAVALARFALNGFGGEWSGTIFSGRGGTWFEVGMVGVRFIALSCVWVIPLVLLGWKPDAFGEAMATLMMGGGASKVIGLTALVSALAALTPPMFLIVSVSAVRFTDLFDRNHWEALFSGRKGELYLIYVVYLGALAMVTVICMPILVAVGLLSTDFATIVGLFMLAFAGGLSVNLLGRLCGFFAASVHGTEARVSPAAPVPSGAGASRVSLSAPAPSSAPRAASASRPVAAAPASKPVSASRPSSPTATPAPSSPTAAPEPHPIPPQGAGSLAHPVRPTSTPTARPAEAEALNPSGKTPLLDARERVDELASRFDTDPEGALAVLRELNDVYAPHPLVLHQLCVLLVRASRPEESREIAAKALSVCLERGALRLAAEVYGAHLDRADEFGLPRDTVIALTDDLRRNGDLSAAEELYSRMLSRDGGERRAVKGLLQIAEKHLESTDYVHAREIYRFLMTRAGDSPFAMHIEQGLAEAERRLAKAS